ncbi:malonyl CoA-acyl carrier protein transacylase [Halalkalibacter hemicellulosilyticusJCM 9152]|uniref:Malonyl CoA-acyl carrier protein transacylase n=1 Tax=Halalkalibacter hemicellulosilyticusJCM 9152 TaxID=1236971 RepID=W4QMX0_9BACI|nr:malonyl CoA-acyl carrier protein transacylase [Halalkalibacter hemicellulosilyticusJCM 9152]
MQWGAWSEGGMAERNSAIKRAEATGFGSISNELGKKAIEQLLVGNKKGVICITPINWSNLKLNIPLVSRFVSQKSTPSKSKQIEKHSKFGYAEVLRIVRQAVAEITSNNIPDDASLMTNGLDSLGAVVLAQTLSQEIGLSLTSVFALNHPTIEDMTDAIVKRIENEESDLSNPTLPRTENESSVEKTSLNITETKENQTEPIAIISTACRLPGDVTSPEEFWDMLLERKDCVTDIPKTRFNIDDVYDPNPNMVGRSYTKSGAFMKDVESFDYEFFGMSFAEARLMDPQQRLLLEVAFEAAYKAGYDKSRLNKSSMGVFIGQMNYDWAHIDIEDALADPYYAAGSAPSITSNRLSYLLGLTGPSMTIDTACSSSLVAVDLAVEKLRKGACSTALVGGVNVMLHPRSYIGCCAANMLSFKGRCATFDEGADGYCRGEGVGAVVLKRLSDAQADGDPILAVIRGSAVNQDGRSASLTAPNGLAQQEVIRQALNEAGLEGSDVDYVECHGTGTSLGDPIEVEALKNVLGEQRSKPLVLGSVKTNIGHLEGAAGIISLIKTIEVLRHRKAPGNVHFKTLNPKINIDNFNVVISANETQLDNHNPNSALIGSISSFGFGGTNAHVILESWGK